MKLYSNKIHKKNNSCFNFDIKNEITNNYYNVLSDRYIKYKSKSNASREKSSKSNNKYIFYKLKDKTIHDYYTNRITNSGNYSNKSKNNNIKTINNLSINLLRKVDKNDANLSKDINLYKINNKIKFNTFNCKNVNKSSDNNFQLLKLLDFKKNVMEYNKLLLKRRSYSCNIKSSNIYLDINITKIIYKNNKVLNNSYNKYKCNTMLISTKFKRNKSFFCTYKNNFNLMNNIKKKNLSTKNLFSLNSLFNKVINNNELKNIIYTPNLNSNNFDLKRSKNSSNNNNNNNDNNNNNYKLNSFSNILINNLNLINTSRNIENDKCFNIRNLKYSSSNFNINIERVNDSCESNNIIIKNNNKKEESLSNNSISIDLKKETNNSLDIININKEYDNSIITKSIFPNLSNFYKIIIIYVIDYTNILQVMRVINEDNLNICVKPIINYNFSKEQLLLKENLLYQNLSIPSISGVSNFLLLDNVNELSILKNIESLLKNNIIDKKIISTKSNILYIKDTKKNINISFSQFNAYIGEIFINFNIFNNSHSNLNDKISFNNSSYLYDLYEWFVNSNTVCCLNKKLENEFLNNVIHKNNLEAYTNMPCIFIRDLNYLFNLQDNNASKTIDSNNKNYKNSYSSNKFVEDTYTLLINYMNLNISKSKKIVVSKFLEILNYIDISSFVNIKLYKSYTFNEKENNDIKSKSLYENLIDLKYNLFFNKNTYNKLKSNSILIKSMNLIKQCDIDNMYKLVSKYNYLNYKNKYKSNSELHNFSYNIIENYIKKLISNNFNLFILLIYVLKQINKINYFTAFIYLFLLSSILFELFEEKKTSDINCLLSLIINRNNNNNNYELNNKYNYVFLIMSNLLILISMNYLSHLISKYCILHKNSNIKHKDSIININMCLNSLAKSLDDYACLSEIIKDELLFNNKNNIIIAFLTNNLKKVIIEINEENHENHLKFINDVIGIFNDDCIISNKFFEFHNYCINDKINNIKLSKKSSNFLSENFVIPVFFNSCFYNIKYFIENKVLIKQIININMNEFNLYFSKPILSKTYIDNNIPKDVWLYPIKLVSENKLVDYINYYKKTDKNLCYDYYSFVNKFSVLFEKNLSNFSFEVKKSYLSKFFEEINYYTSNLYNNNYNKFQLTENFVIINYNFYLLLSNILKNVYIYKTIIIQKIFYGYITRKRFDVLKIKCIKIQRNYRKHLSGRIDIKNIKIYFPMIYNNKCYSHIYVSKMFRLLNNISKN